MKPENAKHEAGTSVAKKLYELPRGSKFRLNGEEFTLNNIDGMYSNVVDADGNVCHFAAWTDVEVV